MKLPLCLLFVSLLAGLTLPSEEAKSQYLDNGGHTMSYCYDTSSGKTCFKHSFKPFLANGSLRVRKSFEEASRWCNLTVPGSSLIISLESQRTVEIFLGRQVLENETIVMDAHSLSTRHSQKWPWVNGHGTVSIGGRTDRFHDAACVESKQGQSLAYCVGHVNPQYPYTCENAGVDNISDHGDVGQPVKYSDKQCICISPQCSNENNQDEVEYDRKWWSCNCARNYDIVCSKEESSDAVTTKIADTEKMLTSTPADFPSSPFLPGITGDTASIPSMDQVPSNPESDEQEKGQRNSLDTKQICLILLLFVAVVFIIVAVILIIRKRKYARRHEVSPMKKTDHNESVSPEYETMVPDNRPSGGVFPIYTELELTQQPKPSNNTTYASVQPTSEVVDMGKSVDYTDIDFPLKDQQKPKSADKGTVSVSPIYSQPFESPTSDSNTEYAEPFKPDKAPTATAPVQSHQAAADQQNIYSLAKAIPSGDPSAIYSEPNKPTKSSASTGKAVKDPIYLNVIEVKPGAEI